jgi:hypothetical protein
MFRNAKGGAVGEKKRQVRALPYSVRLSLTAHGGTASRN